MLGASMHMYLSDVSHVGTLVQKDPSQVTTTVASQSRPLFSQDMPAVEYTALTTMQNRATQSIGVVRIQPLSTLHV
jgi:hypothetical protein